MKTVRALSIAVVALSTLAGCDKSEPKSGHSSDPDYVGTYANVCAMVDGGAYLIGEHGSDGPYELWYISGTRKTPIQLQLTEFPTITPMVDGTAVLDSAGILWRLEGTRATRITGHGKEKQVRLDKAAARYLVLWSANRPPCSD